MRKNWRDYLVKAEEDQKVAFVVFEEDSEAGKAYDLVKGIFSDLEVAKEYADSIHNEEDIFVADYADYVEGNYDYLYEVR